MERISEEKRTKSEKNYLTIEKIPSFATKSYLLRDLLSKVSRSFYLTLAVLPISVRDQIGLAYLFARAADTIADTDLIPKFQRLTYLRKFRELFSEDTINWAAINSIQFGLISHQALPEEKILLEKLEDCFQLYLKFKPADRAHIQHLMTTLTKGMEMDLTMFVNGSATHPQSLKTFKELDLYTYYVAGCVGEFWTNIMCAHCPSLANWDIEKMSAIGIRFGKGLQLTNIIKDIAKDLNQGRCYIPEELLISVGLTTESLLQPEAHLTLQPVLIQLIRQAMEHLDHGWYYAMAIPYSEIRLRLACMWPILLAGETLKLLQKSPNIMHLYRPIKITRSCVYRVIGLTTVTAGSNLIGTTYWKSIRRAINRNMDLTN